MPECDSGHQDSPDEEACGTKLGTGDGTSPVRAAGTRVATSSFRGVCWHRKSKRWQAAINSSGRHVYLGSFDSEEEAARMFDKVAIRVRGAKAKLNFPYEEYLGPDGRLVTDPKLEQLVSEARKALLEKQRWLEANDDSRGGGKRRRLGAAGAEADCQQRSGLYHQTIGEDLAAQCATLHARLPPSHPAFGLSQGMGLSSGVGVAAVGFDAFGPTGWARLDVLSASNVGGAGEPASATLQRLLLMQSARQALMQQGQRGTSGVPSSSLQGVQICGLPPGDGGGTGKASAMGGATLRRLYDGQIAEAGTYDAQSLKLGGVVGVGARGGASDGVAGGEACRNGPNGVGQKGGATEHGQPQHLLLQQQEQQQQSGQMAPPTGLGPGRALLLEAAAAAAAAVVGAGRATTAPDPQVSVAAGAVGLGPRPYSALPKACGGGGGSAADAVAPSGFCLDLRKGPPATSPVSGGGQRWNAHAESTAGPAALRHRLDRGGTAAAAAAAAAAAGAAAGAVDCSVEPSRPLATGDVDQKPPPRATAIDGGGGGGPAAASVTSGIDLASLIGRFLSGVRRHLPAGLEIDSLIPCADGSLLGYTLVRVAEGPGAAGARAAGLVATPQQAGCTGSSSSGRDGGGGASGRGRHGAVHHLNGTADGKDRRMREAAAAADAEGRQQAPPKDEGSGPRGNGASLGDDGGPSAGAAAMTGAGASAAGTGVRAAGAGAGIFFRGAYRDLGFYSSVSDALQACKACMTVVLELKESLMGEAIAEAVAVLGRADDATAVSESPRPPLPPPDANWPSGVEIGAAGGADGDPSQAAVFVARLLQQLSPTVAPSLLRPPPPPPPPPPELQPPLQRQEVTDGYRREPPCVLDQLQLLLKHLQPRQDSGPHHHHRLHHHHEQQQQQQQQHQHQQHQQHQQHTAAGAVRTLVDGSFLPPRAAAPKARRPSADAYGHHDLGSEAHRSGDSNLADGSRLGRLRPQLPQPQCAPLLAERATRPERAGRGLEQRQLERRPQQESWRVREPMDFQAADQDTEPRATPPELLPLAQLVASLSEQNRASSRHCDQPPLSLQLRQQLQQQQQVSPLLQHPLQGSGGELLLPPGATPGQQRQEAKPGKHAEHPLLGPPAAAASSVPPSLELGGVNVMQLHALLQRFTSGGGGGSPSEDAASNGILQALLASCGSATAGGKQVVAAAAAGAAAAAAMEVSDTAEAEGHGGGQLTRNSSDSCDSTNDAPSAEVGRRQRPPSSPSAEPRGTLQGTAGYSNASSSAANVREAPAWGRGLHRGSGDGGSGAATDADGSGGDVVWQQRDEARPGWGRRAGPASLSAAAAAAAAAVAAATAAVPPPPPQHIEADGARERGLYRGGYGQEQVSSGTWLRRRQGYISQCDNHLYDSHTADVCGSYGLG